MVAIFLVSALTCAWFWHGLYKQWLRLDRAASPLLWVVLGWAAWQAFVTVFSASSAWRSWFGSADFGEGAGWYVSVVMLSTLAYALWPRVAYRKFMLLAAVSALGILYALQLTTDMENLWKPYGWPDYLAFIIGWVWMIVHFCYPSLSKKKQFELALAALILLVLAGNRVALVFFVCAMVASQFMLERASLRGVDYLPARRLARIGMCAACLLGLVYTALSFQPSLFVGEFTNNSMPLRLHMNAVGLHAIADEPSRLLLGHGWDAFQNDLFKYTMIDGVALFQHGELNPNLNSILGSAMHPHNQPLEALLASGIVGFVLWFAIAFIIILRMPERLFWRVIPIHVAIVLTSYFWFPISFLIGFMALFWAACIYVTAEGHKPDLVATKQSQWLALAFIPLGFVMLYSGFDQFRAMRYSEWLKNAVHAPYQEYPMGMIMEDANRGGERLQAITSMLMEDLTLNHLIDIKQIGYKKFKSNPLPSDVHRWVERLLGAGYLMGADPQVGAHVGSMDLVLQFFLQTNVVADAAYDQARADSFLFYPASIVRLARVAPLREDLSAPYLYHLEKEGDMPTLTLMLSRLLDANPKHRIALWITGKHLRAQLGKADIGKQMMRQAVDDGVARIYLVTPEEEAAARAD